MPAKDHGANSYLTIVSAVTPTKTIYPDLVVGYLWVDTTVPQLKRCTDVDAPTWVSAEGAGGVTSVTGTAPIASSGGAAPAISITGAAGQVLAGAGPAFTAEPTLGASGTAGSVTMGNATSGTLKLQPVTGALGTVTVSLPAATDTLVGKATTDTLTNKSIAATQITGALAVANGGTGLTALGTALQVLRVNAGATALEYAAASAGAVTRAGGNTTEATTTSTTAVSLITTTSLSIAAAVPIYATVMLRKTSAGFAASVGFMVNATTVVTPAAFTSGAAAAQGGFMQVMFQSALTNYDEPGWFIRGNQSLAPAHGDITNASVLPVATYTDLIFRGLVGDGALTMGADEMHVYTYAVS
mgnify:CR=1 FL=1